ncbi:MAG: roadblock/LC7 domain-containing protein [ANME-2 cluster archaeon]|nr:roadblock/LC7 domain-containing protein [ANME-2 cluster archaeon]
MTTTTTEMLQEILIELKNLGSIEACVIASRDGLLMSSEMPQGVVDETFAAMSATMLGAAETATSELNKGLPNRVIVESKNAKLICMGAGPKALLVATTDSDAGLGLILLEFEKAVARIKEII